MSRTTLFSSSLLAISLMGSAPVLAADDAALEEVRAKMNAMFQEIAPENINRSPVDGWYTVQKGSVVAYVSEDGRYLLQGDMIDLTGFNLDGGGKTAAELVASGHIGVVGTSLFIDLDGGEVIVAAADNTLLATFTDGGAGFVLDDDVLV